MLNKLVKETITSEKAFYEENMSERNYTQSSPLEHVVGKEDYPSFSAILDTFSSKSRIPMQWRRCKV